jgi:hypothetical protein
MSAKAIPAIRRNQALGRVSGPASSCRLGQVAQVLVAGLIAIAVGWFAIADSYDQSFEHYASHTSAGLNHPSAPAVSGHEHDGCGPTPGCVPVVLQTPQLALWSLMLLPGRLVPLKDAAAPMNIPDPSGHVPIGRSLRV